MHNNKKAWMIAVGGVTAAIALAGAANSAPGKAAAAAHPKGAAAVDTARLLAADKEPGSWLAAGRDYSEQRYSPLTGINRPTSASWAWPGTGTSTPSAARRRRRWSWTACSTSPRPGAR